MKFKLIAAIVAVVAIAGFSSAQAQDCGCGGGVSYGGYGAYSGVVESGCGGYGSYGDVGYSAASCYRGLSSSAASSLWAGYSEAVADSAAVAAVAVSVEDALAIQTVDVAADAEQHLAVAVAELLTLALYAADISVAAAVD